MPETEPNQAKSPGDERSEADRSTHSESPGAQPAGPARKLLSDYLSMAGFNVLSLGVSFLNTSAALKLMGRSAYGDIVSCTSTVLLISLFVTEWTAQSAVRFGTAEFVESGQVTRTFWNRLSVVVCCLAALFPPIFLGFRHFSGDLGFTRLTLTFLAVYLPLSTYWLHVQRFLPATGRPRLLYPLIFLERSILLSVIVISHFLDRLTIANVLAGYVLGSLAAGALSTFLIRHSIGRPRWPERKPLTQILNYSWPLIPSIWVGAMSTNALDYLFVRRYVGSAQLGVYSLGVQISGIVQQLPQIAGTLWTPRVIRFRLQEDRSRLRRFVQREFILLQWCWVAACFAGAACFAWQGPHFVPANYALLTHLVWPLALVTSIVPVWYVMWNPLLSAFEMTRTIMWVSMATGLMNLVANLSLIPRYGAVGSAWASVMSYMATCVVTELLASRSGSSEIPRRGIAFYLPNLSMAAAVLLVHVVFGSTP